ncbi:hypothetical protein Scani_24530 [Streptomyces caniferus]|uniref:Uncharacterized protein n=1 Tax=Streptomyces caniferus TaxID=285557 RepID=A0A640S982_9ACTN|nr:hypothetical protein Scani_24530 [Streptomyces caniferus]
MRVLQPLGGAGRELAPVAHGGGEFLAGVTDGAGALAKVFRDIGETGARDSDREAYCGLAIIPTLWPRIKLARDAEWVEARGMEATSYPEAMKGIGFGWESNAASARRCWERDWAVVVEVPQTPCTTCEAGNGEQCRTRRGRLGRGFGQDGGGLLRASVDGVGGRWRGRPGPG